MVKQGLRAVFAIVAITISVLILDYRLANTAETAPMNVSARVERRSPSIQTNAPTGIEVTPVDVRIGKITGRETALLAISSNDPNGVYVRIKFVDDFASTATVTGFGQPIELTTGMQKIVLVPYVGKNVDTLRVDYEFDLKPNIHPGKFQFPLRFDVLPR
jgi:hypothetical protein